MGKKPPKSAAGTPATAKKAKGGGDPWSGSKGWKSFDVGDEFLLGAEEGGFAGLEILDDPTIIDATALTGIAWALAIAMLASLHANPCFAGTAATTLWHPACTLITCSLPHRSALR